MCTGTDITVGDITYRHLDFNNGIHITVLHVFGVCTGTDNTLKDAIYITASTFKYLVFTGTYYSFRDTYF